MQQPDDDQHRSFGVRWAKRIMPVKLQKLMRHSAIETTLRYYANIDADDLAADLWREYAPVGIRLECGKAIRQERI